MSLNPGWGPSLVFKWRTVEGAIIPRNLKLENDFLGKKKRKIIVIWMLKCPIELFRHFLLQVDCGRDHLGYLAILWGFHIQSVNV